MKRNLKKLIKEYIQHCIKESLITEKYIQSVAHKTATGEKFEQSDISNLFSMITSYNITKNPTEAEVSAAAWTNLVSGLSEEDKKYASQAYQASVELAKLQKLKKSLEDKPISVMSPEYDELEDKLNDISDKRDEIEDRIKRISLHLAKKHKAPKEISSEKLSNPYKEIHGKDINPNDPKWSEKTKH